MSNILGLIADQARHFTPSSPREYLALQIARKLGDSSAFRQYLVLFEHYPEELLLQVFHKCSEQGSPNGAAFMHTFRELTARTS